MSANFADFFFDERRRIRRNRWEGANVEPVEVHPDVERRVMRSHCTSTRLVRDHPVEEGGVTAKDFRPRRMIHTAGAMHSGPAVTRISWRGIGTSRSGMRALPSTSIAVSREAGIVRRGCKHRREWPILGLGKILFAVSIDNPLPTPTIRLATRTRSRGDFQGGPVRVQIGCKAAPAEAPAVRFDQAHGEGVVTTQK